MHRASAADCVCRQPAKSTELQQSGVSPPYLVAVKFMHRSHGNIRLDCQCTRAFIELVRLRDPVYIH